MSVRNCILPLAGLLHTSLDSATEVYVGVRPLSSNEVEMQQGVDGDVRGSHIEEVKEDLNPYSNSDEWSDENESEGEGECEGENEFDSKESENKSDEELMNDSGLVAKDLDY
ncbi:hypothetical protein BC629DRAFT_1440148 [Irpex lacteus]|nr:hypothetical protein BC629DRAFT_1440148 [Irpex lacteus]